MMRFGIKLRHCNLSEVGELCANSRMQGKGIEETIKICVDHGIGQDFEGGFSNLTTTK